MLLDGFVYSRKRRDTFNEHVLHQIVAPPPPSPPSFHDPEEPPLTGQRSVPLHEEFSGKVVHDSEHADSQVKRTAERSIEITEIAEDAPPKSPRSTTSGLAVPLVANISSTTTNNSLDRSTHTTVAVDHLTSSSSVSVFDTDRVSSSASTSVRESSDDETRLGTTSRLLAESPGDTSTKFPDVDGNAVVSGGPIAKIARIDAVDFERDTGKALTSASSDIAGGSDSTAKTTTSASGVASTKLGVDSNDYDEVVGGTTENDSGVPPANYGGDPAVADGTVEPTAASLEIRWNGPTEDQQSHVSNSDSNDVLVPVELDQEEKNVSVISPKNVDNEITSSNDTENIGKSEEDAVKMKVVEDRDEDASGEKNSLENDGGRTRNAAEKSQTSDVVKETQELSQEYSSSESEASSNAKAAEQSEELQRDYPVPIYSYGHDEVEIVDLQRKIAETRHAANSPDAKSIFDNDVKTNAAFRETRDKNDPRVVARERNDEEFLRKFEEKFRETDGIDESVENLPSIKTDRNSLATDTLHDNTVHDSSSADHPSNSPIIQRVQIVEVPVYRDAHSDSQSFSSSSSPHRVLINVTIATEDSPVASSRSLYVLSVSVPTEGDAAGRININQAQVHERPPESYAASMKKIPANDAAQSIHAVDTRLPPPPQPPASPPAPPVWAGGECECSCPCMGSSSDEWDNFSAIDDNPEQEHDSVNSTFLLAEQSLNTKRRNEESSTKDSVRFDASSATEDYYSSSSDDIAETSESENETTSSSTYEPEVSTDMWACSGTTPLPPEPTILILEGEASFTIVFLCLLYFFLVPHIWLTLFEHFHFLFSDANAHFFACRGPVADSC